MKEFFKKITAVISMITASVFCVFGLSLFNEEIEACVFPKILGQKVLSQRMTEWNDNISGAEILLFGPSTCEVGIDPKFFHTHGVSAFNLCSSAQSPETTAILIDFILDKKQPKYAVLDYYTAYEDVFLSGFESGVDYAINQDIYKTMAFCFAAKNDMNTVFTTTYAQLKHKLFGLNPTAHWDSPYRHLGWRESLRPPFECDTITAKRFSSHNGLTRLESKLSNYGISVIRVLPPLPCSTVSVNADVTVDINGNDWPLAKVDTLYYDDHHLRGVGAELYSEWLAGQVAGLLN